MVRTGTTMLQRVICCRVKIQCCFTTINDRLMKNIKSTDIKQLFLEKSEKKVSVAKVNYYRYGKWANLLYHRVWKIGITLAISRHTYLKGTTAYKNCQKSWWLSSVCVDLQCLRLGTVIKRDVKIKVFWYVTPRKVS